MAIRVHSIETFGTSDGPGIRMVIFTQGCLFRCLYCQNPDTQEIAGGKEYAPKELLALAKKQRPYFGSEGGVTLSGGEPTLQAKALLPFFRMLQKENIPTALDTNGGIVNSDVKKLYALTDLLLLDIKHIDNERHTKLTGVPNTNPLAMAAYRESTGKPMWLRYVLVPGYNESEETLVRFGKMFGGYKTVERVELLPYHTLGSYKYTELGKQNPLAGVLPPTPGSIIRARDILQRFFRVVSVH